MSKIPRNKWTADEKEFDRLVRLMESPSQTARIEGRLEFRQLEARFTKEQLDAMRERIK